MDWRIDFLPGVCISIGYSNITSSSTLNPYQSSINIISNLMIRLEVKSGNDTFMPD
jgi:hypothetical protein